MNIEFMRKACLLCDKSTCGYKTGCIAVRNSQVILEAWNKTLPGETFCQHGECIREKEYLHGGKDIQKVCSIHAEALLVAQAAAQGIALAGCTVFLTTFPCLICSRLLSQTKIAKLYFMSDYMGSNAGKAFFENAGIAIEQITEQTVWQ